MAKPPYFLKFYRFFKGLSLRVKCLNTTCKDYDKKKWIADPSEIPVLKRVEGIREFNLGRDLESVCPECKEPKFCFDSMALSDCDYKIETTSMPDKALTGNSKTTLSGQTPKGKLTVVEQMTRVTYMNIFTCPYGSQKLTAAAV